MGIFTLVLPPIPLGTSFAGQSILITGASAGIGLECARLLLRLKATKLYLPVRSLERGELVRTELLNDATVQKNNPDATIELFQLDLSKYSSVTAFSDTIKARVKNLDAVILNAGTGAFNFIRAPEAPQNEMNLQVNYLSNALLSLLLLPLLEKSSRPNGMHPRLLFVSSIGGNKTYLEKAPFKLPSPKIVTALNVPGSYGGLERYSLSKLFVQLWVQQLASQIPSEHVVVNSVCPGWTQSSIDRGLPFGLRQLVGGIRRVTGRTTEEGASLYVHALLAPLVGNGAFYSDGVVLE
jgi:NAD(P)-dependent dehydrogenase (short-subunit alcohol dehydrogenase family)